MIVEISRCAWKEMHKNHPFKNKKDFSMVQYISKNHTPLIIENDCGCEECFYQYRSVVNV